MKRMTRIILVAFLVLPAAWSASAQANKPQAEDPLRVLIIGDMVYQQARGVSNVHKGEVTVEFATWPSGIVSNSTNALKHLDQLIGKLDRNGKPVPEEKWPKWDMIHVNVGLGDLVHRVPDIKDLRVLPIHIGGVMATDAKQYEKNLNEVINRLKQTKAKIVWASTTPIRHSASNVFEKGSEVEYNAIAAKVMAKHGVPVNDMYTFVKHLINMDKPASHGADPFNFDKKPIHMPIVRAIERTFGIQAMPETDEEKAVKAAQTKPAPAQG
jgi:hypothetical protein